MSDRPLHRALLVAGLLATPVALATPAQAAAPTPCNGIFTTDASDDGVFNKGGQADIAGATDEQAPDQLELLNVFVNSEGGKTTLNLTIKNLNREVPQGVSSTGGNWYYGYWLHGGRVRFVRAANTGEGDIVYKYGYVTSETQGGDKVAGVYETEGDTTGSFNEGPNGVVSIVIPPEIGGKPGETLGALAGTAETIEGRDDFAGVNHQTDESPDEYSQVDPEGPSLTVTACPAAGGGGGTTPPPTGGGDPGGGTGGGTPPAGGGSTPAPTPAPAAPGEFLPLKAAANLGSARKGKKKRALSFKVTASKPISNLRLALKPVKGGVAVGTASITSLKAGTSKVKLKVTKKLKPGSYVLASNGVVDGRTLGATQKVKVKK
jgi:hypothetical protein